jgi:hypothetical protein
MEREPSPTVVDMTALEAGVNRLQGIIDGSIPPTTKRERKTARTFGRLRDQIEIEASPRIGRIQDILRHHQETEE